MEHDRRFCVDFILDRMRDALLSKDDIMAELNSNKETKFTVSMKDVDDKIIKGTIIIKEIIKEEE